MLASMGELCFASSRAFPPSPCFFLRIAPQAAFAQDAQHQTATSDAPAQAQHVDASPTAQPVVNVNAVNVVSQVLKNTVKTPTTAQAPSAAQASTQTPAAPSEQKATQTDTTPYLTKASFTRKRALSF
jgi:hypothetical protein